MKRLLQKIVRLWPVWGMLAAMPLLIPATAHIETNTDNVVQWLPEGSDERADYDRFTELFGADQVVVVSWPGATLEDERVGKLAVALVDNDDAERPLIERVKTAPQMMQRLTNEPLNLGETEARRRLEGIFLARFGTATAMVVELTDEGKRQQDAVVDHVLATAKDECDLARNDLRLGGNAYEAVAVDEASAAGVKLFSAVAIGIGILVALVCFRSLRLTLIALAAAIFSQLLVIAFIYYTGDSLNAVSIIVPTLVYVLTVSGAVHLINYYRDAVEEHGSAGAVGRMLRAGWLPCLMAAGSTAIGLISLTVSQIAPVRTFGFYSAIGLTASIVVLLTMLPALLHAWPAQGGSRRSPAQPPANQANRTTWADRLCGWIVARHAWVSVASLVAIVAIGLGMLHTTTSVKITRMFPGDSELIRNYTWLEDHVGPLVSIETLVTFDEDCSLNTLERTELVAEVENAIREEAEVGGTLSAATFAPAIPAGGNTQADAAREAINASLTEQKDDLQAAQLLAIDDGKELWRITARIPAVHEMDYGVFTRRIRERVDPVMQARRDDGLTGAEVAYTGMSPLINKATGQLLDDLSNSFLMAVVLICPVMMVMLRGVWAGLLSMIPNVVPAAMIFGLLGWLGQPLDIGAVLTASVALGIAVDDTFHFLTWFRRGVERGLSRRDAVADAYRRCATAMVQTTVICGCGLSVYIFSEFVPTNRFAVLMGALLLSALVADLILLPALLAGPIGYLFAPSRARTAARPRMARPSLVPASLLPGRAAAGAMSFAATVLLMLVGGLMLPGCLPYFNHMVATDDREETDQEEETRNFHFSTREATAGEDDGTSHAAAGEAVPAAPVVTESERRLTADSELDVDWSEAAIERDEPANDAAVAANDRNVADAIDNVEVEREATSDDSAAADSIDNVEVPTEHAEATTPGDEEPAEDSVEGSVANEESASHNRRLVDAWLPREDATDEDTIDVEDAQNDPTENEDVPSAPQPHSPALRMELANAAKIHGHYSDGSPSYLCKIYLNADRETLKRVKSVQYFLHPTIRPDQHTETRRANDGFPIALELWGAFEVRAIVTLRDGTTRELRHWIELP